MQIRRSILSCLTALIIPAFHPAPAAAQTGFQIHGRVLDPVRAPVAGARVTVAAEDGVDSLSAVSDARGEFIIALPPGRYAVTVAADGFVESTASLDATQTESDRHEFLLRVAGVKE